MPPPDDQLPAIIEPPRPPTIAPPADTYIVPALITDAGGDQAGWRYVEFFTANINNDHTRRAYARACSRFFAWCENRGLSLTTIRPFDVAAWVKELQEKHGAPGVKQQLAAVRMLFDWLVTGQVVPMNPAAAVRGPKHVVKTGKTPVLEGDEWRQLLDQHSDRDLARSARPGADRDAHLFLRAHHRGAEDEGRGSPAARRGLDGAAARERRQGACDAVPSRARRGVARLHRRRRHRRGPQGLAVPHRAPAQRQCRCTDRPMNQYAAWLMVRRRAAAAGITAPIGNHTFRATGITAYLANGGALEHAQEMAAHESPRTTKLYDRTKERLTQDEVERIRL